MMIDDANWSVKVTFELVKSNVLLDICLIRRKIVSLLLLQMKTNIHMHNIIVFLTTPCINSAAISS